MRNAFLVLILRFHVIDIDCRDKLRHSCFVVIHPCVSLHRSVRIEWLTWLETSENVFDVTGVDLDFQIQYLAIVNESSIKFKIRKKTPLIWSRIDYQNNAKKLKKSWSILCNHGQNYFQRCSDLTDIGLFDSITLSLVPFRLCSGAWRFIHHLNSQLYQFHRIAVLIISTVPTPFPIPNFIVTTENFKDFDISCTSARIRLQFFLHERSIDISPIFVRLMHRQVFCSWICRTRDSRDCRDLDDVVLRELFYP